jgi:hypothetical protein
MNEREDSTWSVGIATVNTDDESYDRVSLMVNDGCIFMNIQSAKHLVKVLLLTIAEVESWGEK